MIPLEKRIGRYHIFSYASAIESPAFIERLLASPVIEGKGRNGIRIAEAQGVKLAVRRYVHGGLFRALTGDLFLDEGRVKREADVIAHLHESAFPVVAPFCAIAEKTLLFRRLYLVTVFEDDAVSLLEYLAYGTRRQRLRAVRRLAEDLWRMEQAGVYHPDLHLGNVLVRKDGSLVFLDFDRACEKPMAPRDVELMVRRLARFADKMERQGRLRISPEEKILFLRTYRRFSGNDLLPVMQAMQRTRGVGHRIAWSIESFLYRGKQ